MKGLVQIANALQQGKQVIRNNAGWIDLFGFIELNDKQYIVDCFGDEYTGSFDGEWSILEDDDDDCEFELVHDPNDYEYTPEEAEMLGLYWDETLKGYYPKY